MVLPASPPEPLSRKTIQVSYGDPLQHVLLPTAAAESDIAAGLTSSPQISIDSPTDGSVSTEGLVQVTGRVWTRVASVDPEQVEVAPQRPIVQSLQCRQRSIVMSE